MGLAAAAALLACAGCGYKGPLYLPERNVTVVTHPAQGAQGSPATPGTPAAPGTSAAKQKDKTPPGSTPPGSSTPPPAPPPQ